MLDHMGCPHLLAADLRSSFICFHLYFLILLAGTKGSQRCLTQDSVGSPPQRREPSSQFPDTLLAGDSPAWSSGCESSACLGH